MTGIPLKPLREILWHNCPYDISQEATLELKIYLEYMATRIAHQALQEFRGLNSNRERQGLCPLKRLNGQAVQKACNNILKPETVNKMGLQPQGIVSPGGNRMDMNRNATKSAKKDITEHGGTNGL